MTKPVMLVILDGFGWREDPADNAVALANKPNFDRLWASCPHAFLHTLAAASSACRTGQMGNSEVGHLNIGAGPRGDAGTAAHRRRHRGRLARAEPGA